MLSTLVGIFTASSKDDVRAEAEALFDQAFGAGAWEMRGAHVSGTKDGEGNETWRGEFEARVTGT